MSLVTRTPLELVEDNLRRPTGRWGRVAGHLMAVQHRTLTEWAMGLMDVRPTDRVLDIGCGSGLAVRRLAEVATDGLVTGLDYSAEMVAQATARNADGVRRGQVEVRHGDAMSLPFVDGRFDQVCAIETFPFWRDPLRGLREARRVLRPGGLLTVTVEMSKEASGRTSRQRLFGRRFTQRSVDHGMRVPSGPELVGLLRQAGFVDTRYVAEPSRSLGWLTVQGRR